MQSSILPSRSSLRRFSPGLKSRRGVTFLEVTGCLLAVGAGVWLGAGYLGINLHAAAYTALTETALIEKMPEEWRPAPPAGMEPLTSVQQELALQRELESIQSDLEGLRAEESSSLPKQLYVPENLSALHPDLAVRRQQTLAFWAQLGGVRAEVDNLQRSTDEFMNEQNVWKVLEVRRRAYLYGAKAVKAAMNDRVDPQALQFANQLVHWYQGGADLYGEAMKVWQGQNLPNEGISSDALLAQVQKQHVNEALLLFQRGDRLCEVLHRRYQVSFPEIEDPAILGSH